MLEEPLSPKPLRRPRELQDFASLNEVGAHRWIHTEQRGMSPAGARRLAAWLLKAADYLDQENQKK